MSAAELLLIFAASFMASVHCAAMCGGFAASLARPNQAGASLARMGAYHAGKLFTYLFIGALAGVAGAALLANQSMLAAQAVFSALAGALIVVVGLQTLGLLPGQNLVNRLAARLWLGPYLGSILRVFRDRPSLDGAFFLGLFNGFLPCGLVYTFALAAAGTRSLGDAILTMAAFGLGTVPMLVAVGLGSTLLAGWRRLRPALARASGVLLIALGAITVMRGGPLLPTFAAGAPSPSAHNHAAHGADHHHLTVAAVSASAHLEPAPAPDFTLVNEAGETVSLKDYAGQVVALNFIFTSCTSTCPLLTATFRAVQEALGPALSRQTRLVSITVDPETDTPAVLTAYAEARGADLALWDFLTGSPDAIQAVAASYAVYAEKTAEGVAHTETMLLIDKQGRLRAAYGLHTDPQVVLDKIEQLARE